ncbi:MAG: thiamine diphosphokinase, partial [Holosporaceae bacterium]|nr:thiamine diphosphokinase [Holosporaceae bacterium]
MIKIPEDLSKYKSILCLNGDLICDLIGDINLPIVAADGAANTLIQNGIEPDIIIGDLDSVDDNTLLCRTHLKIDSQVHTDFEKALNFIEEKSISPAIVMGVDGGYIDHVLGNISIFSRTNFIAISKDIIFMTIDDYKI